ncbi:MAG: hypothetical protein R3B89_08320 [Polyangiaceae bacterium]
MKTRRLMPLGSLLPLLLLLGCAGSQERFKDRPIVWRVDDTRNIPPPDEREFFPLPFGSDVFIHGQLTRALSLPDREPAWNTNALDEVPDSSWFTNRIGVRQVTPAEAAIGASAAGPPTLPITVLSAKSGGANPGFFVKDARDRKFIVKFDTKENPELQTSASVIVNRVIWTLGYNVPNDDIFVFSRNQIQLAPDAKLKDEYDNKRPMTGADVDRALGEAPRLADGRYRASSSEFLDGVPKGGFPARGVRDDDPNDLIPHQHRREVRGMRVIGAWLNHTDMKEDNTLDMYVEEGGRHFLRHYFLDFGEALGGHPAEKNRHEDGFEYLWDWDAQPRALISLGLWQRPWEEVRDTPWLSVGPFGAKPFDPHTWHEAYPYWPFYELDEADGFWGAKLVMRVDRPILEAIVKRGQLSDPEAAEYLVKTLLARREKVGRAYLEALSPLDDFHFERTPGGDAQLCAVDLGLVYRLAHSGVVEVLDSDDRVVAEHTVHERGGVCLPVHGDGYQIRRLRVVRGRDVKPAMQVHFRLDGRPRVLGLIRKEHR